MADFTFKYNLNKVDSISISIVFGSIVSKFKYLYIILRTQKSIEI